MWTCATLYASTRRRLIGYSKTNKPNRSKKLRFGGAPEIGLFRPYLSYLEGVAGGVFCPPVGWVLCYHYITKQQFVKRFTLKED